MRIAPRRAPDRLLRLLVRALRGRRGRALAGGQARRVGRARHAVLRRRRRGRWSRSWSLLAGRAYFVEHDEVEIEVAPALVGARPGRGRRLRRAAIAVTAAAAKLAAERGAARRGAARARDRRARRRSAVDRESREMAAAVLAPPARAAAASAGVPAGGEVLHTVRRPRGRRPGGARPRVDAIGAQAVVVGRRGRLRRARERPGGRRARLSDRLGVDVREAGRGALRAEADLQRRPRRPPRGRRRHAPRRRPALRRGTPGARLVLPARARPARCSSTRNRRPRRAGPSKPSARGRNRAPWRERGSLMGFSATANGA